MRSIKQYQDNKFNSSLQSMLGQSLWYTRCCILSVSLMSGFGLPWNYDSTRVNNWLDISDSRNDEYKIPENITLLRAIYKKGDPHYCNTYNGNERDYRNYVWDDASFKKTIVPSAQAYLILNEIMLSKYFYKSIENQYREAESLSEKSELALLLLNSAKIQCQFMSDFLRNADGLFVSKDDISQNPYGEPILEENECTPDVSDQALVMKAFSMLSSTLDDSRFPLFKDDEFSAACRKKAGEIYEVFLDSPDDIYGSKTKDLCSVVSSCIEYYKSCDTSGDVLDYITRLSLELESRIDMSGNLVRYPDENKLTSNSSCFSAIKTLVESYRLTDIHKLLDSSLSLYKKLNVLWDPVNGLYSLDNDDKYKYTARDVGSVISGLNSLRLFAGEGYRDDAESKLVAFFNNTVNNSKLIQSCLPAPPSEDYEHLFRRMKSGLENITSSYFCHSDIPLSQESGIAPVFAKKFTFKPKKRTYDINSSSFYSEYSLFAANEMLQMNFPEIECFYDKKTCSNQDNDESCDNANITAQEIRIETEQNAENENNE